MSTVRVLNPVAKTIDQHVVRAARPNTLDGKTVGLYWNMKSGGDVALRRVEELLSEHYTDLSFRHYNGALGGVIRMMTGTQATDIARECDAVIGTTAD